MAVQPGSTRVKVGGDEWVFVFDEMDLADAFRIKSQAGLTPIEMVNGFMNGDPAAMRALVWFLRTKSGENVHINEINFKFADLEVEAWQPEVEEPEHGWLDDAEREAAIAAARPKAPVTRLH